MYPTFVEYDPNAWSGAIFLNSHSGDTFEYAYGTFTVPSATSTTWCSAAALWVGLGGNDVQDLIQTGVQLIGNGSVVTYFPLREYVSGDDPDECYASPCYLGFNVYAGDSMLAEVWAGDSSCRSPNFSGGYGCFYLVDITSGWSSLSELPQYAQFQGLSAEFMAEDNSAAACSGDEAYTDYGTVYVHFDAEDTNGNMHSFRSDPTGYTRVVSANSSNQQLGFAAVNTNSDLLTLSWIQGQ
ncbi:MAG: G1 family glutamic endopeptidase [Polyangia bacterium]|jgi:hypothetical protein